MSDRQPDDALSLVLAQVPDALTGIYIDTWTAGSDGTVAEIRLRVYRGQEERAERGLEALADFMGRALNAVGRTDCQSDEYISLTGYFGPRKRPRYHRGRYAEEVLQLGEEGA